MHMHNYCTDVVVVARFFIHFGNVLCIFRAADSEMLTREGIYTMKAMHKIHACSHTYTQEAAACEIYTKNV